MSAPLSHLRVPYQALDLAHTPVEIGAIVDLYRRADKARWRPFTLATLDFRAGGLSARRAVEILAHLEEDGLLKVVDAGGPRSARKVALRDPTTGVFCLPDSPAERSNADGHVIVDESGTLKTGAERKPERWAERSNADGHVIVDESGTQSGTQAGTPNRARAASSNLHPPGRDPSTVSDPRDIVEQGSTSSPDPAEPEQQDGPQEPQQDRGAPHSPAEDPQDAASGQPGASTSMLEGDQGGGSAAEPATPKPGKAEPHWTADLWAQLQAIRREHEPTTRGQGLTSKRKANLQTRCKELRQAGLSRDDLLRAARWVHESANIRAEGARTTGDPLAVLLRPAHCVEYCELAEAEEREAATLPDRREGERLDGDERRSDARQATGHGRPPAGSRALEALARRVAEREAAKAAAEATQAPALRLVET